MTDENPEARIADLERQLAEAKASTGWSRRRPGGANAIGNLIGGAIGAIGGCVGGAAALTAVLPSTALWTSAIVCDGPNQLMTNTSHYSYKPGQSGTAIDFQC